MSERDTESEKLQFFPVVIDRDTAIFITDNFPKTLSIEELKKFGKITPQKRSSVALFTKNVEEALAQKGPTIQLAITAEELNDIGNISFELERNRKTLSEKLGIGNWSPSVHPFFDAFLLIAKQLPFINLEEMSSYTNFRELIA